MALRFDQLEDASIDVIIATYCIRNGHVLLHPDRDFEPMTEHLGLRTV